MEWRVSVVMVLISRYLVPFFLFLIFSRLTPRYHRILVFKVVVSLYSACVQRSVRYSNAPPTSKLLTAVMLSCSCCIDIRIRMVLYGFAILLEALRRVCCDANGWKRGVC